MTTGRRGQVRQEPIALSEEDLDQLQAETERRAEEYESEHAFTDAQVGRARDLFREYARRFGS